MENIRKKDKMKLIIIILMIHDGHTTYVIYAIYTYNEIKNVNK